MDGSEPTHSPYRCCCHSSRRAQAHCEAQHSFPGVQTVSLATAAPAEAAATGIAAKQTASRTRGLDRPSQERCRVLGSPGAPVACHLPPTLLCFSLCQVALGSASQPQPPPARSQAEGTDPLVGEDAPPPRHQDAAAARARGNAVELSYSGKFMGFAKARAGLQHCHQKQKRTRTESGCAQGHGAEVPRAQALWPPQGMCVPTKLSVHQIISVTNAASI